MNTDSDSNNGPAKNLAKMDESMEEEEASRGKMRTRLRKDAQSRSSRDTASRKGQPSPMKTRSKGSRFKKFLQDWLNKSENREAVDKQLESVTEGDQVDYGVLLKDIKEVDQIFKKGEHSFDAVLNQLLLVNFAVIDETGGESE